MCVSTEVLIDVFPTRVFSLVYVYCMHICTGVSINAKCRSRNYHRTVLFAGRNPSIIELQIMQLVTDPVEQQLMINDG